MWRVAQTMRAMAKPTPECLGVDCGPGGTGTHAVGEETPDRYTYECDDPDLVRSANSHDPVKNAAQMR